MKKGIAMVVGVVMVVSGAICQENVDVSMFDFYTNLVDKQANKNKQANTYKIERPAISENVFKKMTAAYFSKISTGDPTLANLNNYASLKLDQLKANINAAGFICKDTRTPVIYSLNFNGGLDENIVTVFNNGSLSYDFNARLEMHFFQNTYWYATGDKTNLERYKTEVTQNLVAAYALENRNLNEALTSIEEPERGTLQQKILALKTDLPTKINDSIENYLASKLSFASVRMIWGNPFVSLGGQKFNLYDEKNFADPAKLIEKKEFLAVETGVAFNFYFNSRLNLHKWKNIYARVSIGFIKDNIRNYQELNTYRITTEAKDTTISDPAIAGKQSKTEDKKAYPKSTYMEYEGLRLGLDIYKPFTKFTSLHYLFDYRGVTVPNVRDKENWMNLLDMGVGMLFSFPKKDDKKAIVSFEPLVTFQDLAGAFKTEENKIRPLKERIRVQVRVNFPFNYFF